MSLEAIESKRFKRMVSKNFDKVELPSNALHRRRTSLKNLEKSLKIRKFITFKIEL